MRRFVETVLSRPVGVTAFYIVLAALGGVALLRLPVALLPSLSYPALLVWTSFPEAPPDQVERTVTRPVEEVLAGLSGLREMSGRSQIGGSLVRLDFGWNQDLDLATLEVRQKLDRLVGTLPDAAERPLVLGFDPSDRPVMVLALSFDKLGRPGGHGGLVRLRRLGDEVVARRLEQLDGVSRVRVTGGDSPQLEVRVDPARLVSLGLELKDVETALREANVSVAGGTLEKGPFRYAVEVSGEFHDAVDVAGTIISPPDQPPVRLTDVADVRRSTLPRQGMVRYDGCEVLLLEIERRPDANTIRSAEEIRAALGGLRNRLEGVVLEVVVDESVFVRTAVDGVLQALGWGGCLAILVLLIFLRRPRTLLAVAISVPVSLAIALLFFDLLEISLNLISLSGLALGVGLLVDNSIVVAENIARFRERRFGAAEAAVRGTAEVAPAIAASTLTTLAVFLPLSIVEGLAGRLFADQSLAVVCSVAASLLVALTIVPLICSRDRTVRQFRSVGPAAAPGLAAYERCLRVCLSRPRRVVVGALLFLVLSGAAAWWLPREVVPRTDEGRIELLLRLPPDASLSLLSARSKEIEESLWRVPGIDHVLADLGLRDDAWLDLTPRPPYEGELTVVLKQGTSTRETLARIRSLSTSPPTRLMARPVRTQIETLLVEEEADLILDLVSEDRTRTEAVLDRLIARLGTQPALSRAVRSDAERVPAYDLRLHHDALARLGVTAATLDSYLEAVTRGREITRLLHTREAIPVVLRLAARGSGSLEALLAERVPTRGSSLPVGTFVEPEERFLPAVLTRQDRAPVLRALIDLAPGVALQEGIGRVTEAVTAEVPPEIRATVRGANEAFREALAAMGWTLLLSVALVYLILAAQFECPWRPLVVLSVVPLAIGGVALTLRLTGQSWSLMSLTGCVVLVGLAVNDAIVKVDFVRRRQREGSDLRSALEEAGRDRYRAILMTTLTTVLGLTPLALGLGAGGRFQAPLAIAIAGGLTISTALTLLVVPVVYQFIDPSRRQVDRVSRRVVKKPGKGNHQGI